MADAQSIILHQFERSPYSEKIRLALRIKNLDWVGVDVPVILPKPDLMPLTGGYRRTPVLQVGADIYCDTLLMLAELEKRSQDVSLGTADHEGIAKMAAAWAGGKWFQTSASVIFGAIGEHMPPKFIEDRKKMSGRSFDLETMKAAAPFLRDQWRTQLMWIEEQLQAGKGEWLGGPKPSLIDIHAFMNPWFVGKNIPDFLNACFDAMPLTKDWYSRLRKIEGRVPEKISGADAIEIAQGVEPSAKTASTEGELRSFAPGDKVAIAPDDYAKDWVGGALVLANAERVVISRRDDRAGHVHVHFPRVGYILRKA